MQPFPSFAEDGIRKLAQHEVGHWVIARCLNVVSCDVTAKVMASSESAVVQGEGWACISVMQNLSSIDEAAAYLERRILILWAGVVAEALVPRSGLVDCAEASRLAERVPISRDTMAAYDYTQLLRNLKWNLVSGDVETQFNSLLDELWAKTIQMVEANSAIILEIAEHLAYKVEVAGSDNVAVFEAADIEALPVVQEWLKKRNPSAGDSAPTGRDDYSLIGIVPSFSIGWPSFSWP